MVTLSAVTKAKVVDWLQGEIEASEQVVQKLKEMGQPGAAEILQKEIDAERIVLNKLELPTKA